MESLDDWEARAEGWLAGDHRLLTDDDGWKPVRERDGVEMWQRTMSDDRNRMFRWRLPVVGAPADVVFEGFVHRLLDYHREWTREYAGGEIVDVLSPQARVLYQWFEPGIPGVRRRDLCSLELVRDLAPGVKLASFRSVDRRPPVPHHHRIDWWGAALCTTRADGATSELVYVDRENQGGWIPAWAMNPSMPGYLRKQATAVRRFFADGGPAALRPPRAAAAT